MQALFQLYVPIEKAYYKFIVNTDYKFTCLTMKSKIQAHEEGVKSSDRPVLCNNVNKMLAYCIIVCVSPTTFTRLLLVLNMFHAQCLFSYHQNVSNNNIKFLLSGESRILLHISLIQN